MSLHFTPVQILLYMYFRQLSDAFERERAWMERIRDQGDLIETQEFQIIELEETNEEVKYVMLNSFIVSTTV